MIFLGVYICMCIYLSFLNFVKLIGAMLTRTLSSLEKYKQFFSINFVFSQLWNYNNFRLVDDTADHHSFVEFLA